MKAPRKPNSPSDDSSTKSPGVKNRGAKIRGVKEQDEALPSSHCLRNRTRYRLVAARTHVCDRNLGCARWKTLDADFDHRCDRWNWASTYAPCTRAGICGQCAC